MSQQKSGINKAIEWFFYLILIALFLLICVAISVVMGNAQTFPKDQPRQHPALHQHNVETKTFWDDLRVLPVVVLKDEGDLLEAKYTDKFITRTYTFLRVRDFTIGERFKPGTYVLAYFCKEDLVLATAEDIERGRKNYRKELREDRKKK
jgi:hypothetical protein